MLRDTPNRRRIEAALIRFELLHSQGVSVRRAARMLGIGRSTIRRHLSGQRKAKLRPELLVYDAATGTHVIGQRCPTCRAIVVMPCVACRAKLARERAGKPA